MQGHKPYTYIYKQQIFNKLSHIFVSSSSLDTNLLTSLIIRNEKQNIYNQVRGKHTEV